MKNDQTLQQPITQSRQRGAQTISAHLHWCGADPPVHSQPMSLATKAIPHNEVTFLPFSRARISTSCSRTTAALFCIVCAMYGSAADRCSGPRFQEITFSIRLVCGFHFWHDSRVRCRCHCSQPEIELHVF